MRIGGVLRVPTERKDDDCPVCLVSLKEDSKTYSCCASHTTEIVCGHQIHFGCFYKTIMETSRMQCPTCRRELFEEMKRGIKADCAARAPV